MKPVGMEEVTIQIDEEWTAIADAVSFALHEAGFTGDIKFWTAVFGVAVGHLKLLGFPSEEISAMVKHLYKMARAGMDMPKSRRPS